MRIDYSKKKLLPEDYKIILDHAKSGWSFPLASIKINMSQRNFYEAIKGDKLLDDIRLVYYPNYKRGRRNEADKT